MPLLDWNVEVSELGEKITDAEGSAGPEDPEATAMLARIEADETVELIPVSDYERISPLEPH